MNPSHTLPVLPALCLQLAFEDQTNYKFYILDFISYLIYFVKQKSIMYFTPLTVMELSAIFVAIITLI
jgi:hypothetical protein